MELWVVDEEIELEVAHICKLKHLVDNGPLAPVLRDGLLPHIWIVLFLGHFS